VRKSNATNHTDTTRTNTTHGKAMLLVIRWHMLLWLLVAKLGWMVILTKGSILIMIGGIGHDGTDLLRSAAGKYRKDENEIYRSFNIDML
jgi:hypothetical protein